MDDDQKKQDDLAMDVPEYYHSVKDVNGLTKREQIAAMALQGLLSRSGTEGLMIEYVEAAVNFADRLLLKLQETEKELK